MDGQKSVSTGSHTYTNRGKPFQWGERLVCWAQEILGTSPGGMTFESRRVLIDVETGNEITGPQDLGSHVVHPEPDGAYHIHQVVDAQKTEES